jgi:hypothetical protein
VEPGLRLVIGSVMTLTASLVVLPALLRLRSPAATPARVRAAIKGAPQRAGI